MGDAQYFGGEAHGLKTISKVNIRSGIYFDAVNVEYLDGTCSNGWSEEGGKKHVFELNNGASDEGTQLGPDLKLLIFR